MFLSNKFEHSIALTNHNFIKTNFIKLIRKLKNKIFTKLFSFFTYTTKAQYFKKIYIFY